MVVRDDDTTAIRSIMYMSLSYDHRVVDGLNAARFTQTITKNLEQFDLSEVGV
ncbi:MAG: 2-oxo acid dehydrogenase subunit E2 [Gemmatimonadota bacterium]|nr:2-oxo acid dehydrogenase subunit E2 [Gemmatimonadota bacterium]